MKKTLFYLCMAAVLPAFVACEKDAEVDSLIDGKPMGRYTLNASIADAAAGEATRTELTQDGDRTVAKWCAGDEIAVVAGLPEEGGDGVLAKYVLSSGEGLTGTFAGDVAADYMKVFGGIGEGGVMSPLQVTDYYAAVYPYSSAFYVSSNDTGTQSADFGAEIPAVQQYAENSFGPGAMPMAAFWKDGDESILFKPMAAAIRFDLYADAPTTLKSLTLSAAPERAAASYLQTKVGLAGKLSLSARASGLYAEYADPSYDYILLSNWGANEFILNPQLDGATSITVEGDIVLSTDPENPTAVYVVVAPARYADGFTVTMETNDGRQMVKTVADPIVNKPTISYVQQPVLLPGDILNMPALKFEGTEAVETEITSLTAACSYPYIAVTEGVHEGDNLPMWTIDYNSVDCETITLNIGLNNTLAGVRFEGTEMLGGTSINIYEWTELQQLQNADENSMEYPEGFKQSPEGPSAGKLSTMKVQSRSSNAEGVYYLYMYPSHYYDAGIESAGIGKGTTDPYWDGYQDREGDFALISNDGTKIGYIKFRQSSFGSGATYGFGAVEFTTGKELILSSFNKATGELMQNEISVALLDANEAEQEVVMTITAAENNMNQKNGITLPGVEFGKEEYQPVLNAEDWLSAYAVKGAVEGTIEMHLKFAPATATSHTMSFNMLDNGGNVCSSLSVSQPGSQIAYTSAICMQGASNGTLTHNGEWLGCVDVFSQMGGETTVPDKTFDFYESYTLTLSNAEAVTVEFEASAVYNYDETFKWPSGTVGSNDEGKSTIYLSCLTTGGADWISDHTFSASMAQDPMGDGHSFKVAANTTGQERQCEVLVRLTGSGFVVGKLIVIQPAN